MEHYLCKETDYGHQFEQNCDKCVGPCSVCQRLHMFEYCSKFIQ